MELFTTTIYLIVTFDVKINIASGKYVIEIQDQYFRLIFILLFDRTQSFDFKLVIKNFPIQKKNGLSNAKVSSVITFSHALGNWDG